MRSFLGFLLLFLRADSQFLYESRYYASLLYANPADNTYNTVWDALPKTTANYCASNLKNWSAVCNACVNGCGRTGAKTALAYHFASTFSTNTQAVYNFRWGVDTTQGGVLVLDNNIIISTWKKVQWPGSFATANNNQMFSANRNLLPGPHTLEGWAFQGVTEGPPQGMQYQVSGTWYELNQGPLTWQYPSPMVQTLTPNTYSTVGNIRLTLTGAFFGDKPNTVNFYAGSTFKWVCPIVSWTTVQIVCTLPPGEGVLSLIVNSTDYGLSTLATAQTFSYTPPTVSSISPSTLPTLGGRLTFNGNNFGVAPYVTVSGGNPNPASGQCVKFSASPTQFVCDVGAGAGASLTLTLNVANYQVQSTFSYNPPTVTAIYPSGLPTTGGSPISINGTNLGLGFSIAFGSNSATSCVINSLTNQHVDCVLPVGQGVVNVVATVGGQNYPLSGSGLTYTYARPTMYGLSTNTCGTAGGCSIVITGINFGLSATAPAVVKIDGNSGTITFQNHTMIIFQAPSGAGINLALTLAVSSLTSTNSLIFNYAAPVITAVTSKLPVGLPTGGGGVLVISGINFGGSDFAAQVSVALIQGTTTTVCPLITNQLSQTVCNCTVPAGSGKFAVSITVDGQSNTFGSLVNYLPPTINSITPTNVLLTTGGGTVITVNGVNFGPSQITNATVQIASAYYAGGFGTCAVTNWQQSYIVCTAPGGYGTSQIVRVTVPPSSDSENLINFQSPAIGSTGVDVQTGPTSGGTRVLITGTNFGLTAGKVYFGAWAANVTSWLDQQISVFSPRGTGANLLIRIVAPPGNASAIPKWTYALPTVDGITPLTGPTPGGPLVTITGSGFGYDPTVVSVYIGSVFNRNASYVNDTSLTFNLGSGVGVGLIQVMVSGQISKTVTGIQFQFNPPVIASVQGCSNGCPIGAFQMVVWGSNLGSLPGQVQAQVLNVNGSQPLVGTCIAANHSSATITFPSNPMGGNGLPLVLTVGGQTSAPFAVTFQGPTLGPVSPINNVIAGTQLNLVGTGLCDSGNQPLSIAVRLGSSSGSSNAASFNSKPLVCSSPIITGCSTVTCYAPVGLGTGLVVHALIGLQYTIESTQTVSYVSPSLVSGTLRTATLDLTKGATQYSASAQGVTVDMDVMYVPQGFDSWLNVVFFNTQANLTFPCSPAYIYPSSPVVANRTILRCTTTVATVNGTLGFDFKLNVLGATATGSDIFFFLSAPEISRVTTDMKQCSGDGTRIWDCPTEGGPVLTVVGDHFSDSGVLVTINGVSADVQNTSGTVILVKLPKGAGFNVSIVVTTSTAYSTPYNLVSYAAAILQQVWSPGCPGANNIVDCPRAGGVNLTIVGTNFGPQVPIVLVGQQQCTNVQMIASSTQVSCILPSGYSSSTPVLLLQGGGVLAANTLYVAYLQCPAGTQGEITGDTVCYACDAGTFSNMTGMLDCQSCDVGLYSLEGATQCTKCALGTYASQQGQSACTNCQPGKYSQGPGSDSCVPCPAGSIAKTSRSVVCASCSPGFYAPSSGSSSCTPCAQGTYNNRYGADICNECPTGSVTSKLNSTACSQCGVGTFAPAAGLTSCTSCPASQYNSALGQAVCKQCPSGKFSNITSSTKCLDCIPGSYSPTSAATVCLVARPGYYVSAPAQAAQSPCSPGHYSTGYGSTVCGACDIGTSTQSQASVSCTVCNPGTFAVILGSPSCASCPAGTYNTLTKSTTCSSCGLGQYQSSPGKSACLACTIGKYANSEGAVACSPCVSGTYSSATGSTECGICAAGNFSVPSTDDNNNLRGPVACTLCPPGSIQPAPGQRNCQLCPAGFYAGEAGSTTCDRCMAGTYADLGASECSNCTAGRFASSNGAVSCVDCPQGRYSGYEGGSSCDDCPIGSSQSSTGAMLCNPCSTGKFAPFSGLPTCTDCKLGTYGPSSGLDACLPCPLGMFANESSLAACLPCAPGLVAAFPGQWACEQCDAGRYQPYSSQAVCAPAPKGAYVPGRGSTGYLNCSAGMYSLDEGQSQCLPCEPGSFADQPSTVECALCPRGTAQPLTSQTTCNNCLTGFAQPSPGQKVCDECPAGWIAANVSASNCTMCPGGFQQPVSGQSFCTICPKGEFAPPGSPSCKKCKEIDDSSIAPAEGQETCTACPPNAVSDELATTCNCQEGSAMVLDAYNASSMCRKCPLGAKCTNVGTLWAQMETLPGYWEKEEEFHRCYVDAFCPGGSNSPCALNREGPLCSLCVHGTVEQYGRQCLSCNSTGRNVGTLALVVFLAAFLLTLNFYILISSGQHLIRAAREGKGADSVQRRDRFATLFGPPPAKPNFTYKLKIVLGFLQILTNLSSGLQIQWPAGFKQFLSSFDVVSLDLFRFSGMECLITKSDYFDRVWFFVASGPMLVAALALLYLLPGYIYYRGDRHKDDRKAKRQNFWRMVMFSFFLIYPTVSSNVLRTYVCLYIPVENTTFMVADFRVQCYSPEWISYALVVIFFVLMYPVGIPLFFFWMIHRYRHRLREPGVRGELGFLYDAYENSVWYWEMVDMAHKLCVTSIVAFFPWTDQMPAAMCFIVLYLCLLLCFKPYVSKADDRLHLIAQTELFLLVLAGDIFNVGVLPDDVMNTVMSVVLIIAFLLFFVFFLIAALNAAWKLIKRSEKALSYLRRLPFIGGSKMFVHKQKIDKHLAIAHQFYEGVTLYDSTKKPYPGKVISDHQHVPKLKAASHPDASGGLYQERPSVLRAKSESQSSNEQSQHTNTATDNNNISSTQHTDTNE